METNSPGKLVSELKTIGVTTGDKFVLVKSQTSSGGGSVFIGFLAPSLSSGETRDLGFKIAPSGSSIFRQVSYFTLDKNGVWHSSRKQTVVTGSAIVEFLGSGEGLVVLIILLVAVVLLIRAVRELKKQESRKI